jgi:hypothetical protein
MTQESNKPVEMLACPNPWCTSTTKPLPVALKREGWRVACACGVSTPRRATEAEAVATWQNRLSSTPTAADRNAVLEDDAYELLAAAYEGEGRPITSIDLRNRNTGSQGVRWVRTECAISAIRAALASASPTAAAAAADMPGLAGELQRLFERIDDRNEAEDLIGWEASAADLAQLLTDKSRRDLILSALRHPPSDEWRAIETAPKATDDYGIGPWLLLFVPEGLDAPNMVTVGTYFREELRDDQGRFLGGEWTAVDADMMRSAYIKPTHWKPLPPPPREGER